MSEVRDPNPGDSGAEDEHLPELRVPGTVLLTKEARLERARVAGVESAKTWYEQGNWPPIPFIAANKYLEAQYKDEYDAFVAAWRDWWRNAPSSDQGH